MLVNAQGNIDRNSSSSRNQGHVKRSEFLYRHLLLVEGFIKVMNSLVMTLKEETGASVWLLIHSCILCQLRR